MHNGCEGMHNGCEGHTSIFLYMLSGVFTQNAMLTSNKIKGLADISAGQRPAKGYAKRFKAESLVDNGTRRNPESAMFRKAYSLEFIVRPIRRALPANMRKAFSLHGSRGRSPSICTSAFSLLCEHALGHFKKYRIRLAQVTHVGSPAGTVLPAQRAVPAGLDTLFL